MDGDGDIDILIADFVTGDNKIFYANNTDGEGDFDFYSYVYVDTNNIYEINSINGADINNDNKEDVICSSYNNILFFYLNQGNGNFRNKNIIDSNIVINESGCFDINNNGDIDILFRGINEVGWYKNKNGVNIEEINQTSFTIYPNPTKNTITIQTEFEITKIELYNNLGQLVLTENNKKTINILNLAKGVYNCNVFRNNGSLGTEKIIIE
jgi:hypothetical protein